jgi:hypothetical protein
VEAAIGTPLRALLSADAETQAWLAGGYHGSWLPPGANRRPFLPLPDGAPAHKDDWT